MKVESFDITKLNDSFLEEFQEILKNNNHIINIRHDDTTFILQRYLKLKIKRKNFTPTIVFKKGDVVFFVNGLDCFKKISIAWELQEEE